MSTLLSSLGLGVLTLFFFSFFLWLFLIYLHFIYLLFFLFFVSHLFFQHCFVSPPSPQSLRCVTVSVRDNEPGVAEEGGAAGLGLFFLAIFSYGKRCILLFPPICYDVGLYIILVCPGRLVLSGLLRLPVAAVPQHRTIGVMGPKGLHQHNLMLGDKGGAKAQS